jgi:L-lactate dehydrogenase
VIDRAGLISCSLGQTTIDQISRNMSIVREVVETMKPFRLDTVLLVVSNPIDLLTSLAHELSGLPTSQVLGSGTFLDSVRLRGLVAMRAGVSTYRSCGLFEVGLMEF